MVLRLRRKKPANKKNAGRSPHFQDADHALFTAIGGKVLFRLWSRCLRSGRRSERRITVRCAVAAIRCAVTIGGTVAVRTVAITAVVGVAITVTAAITVSTTIT